MKKTDTLIIGAGLSGLSAAFGLQGKKDYLLIEKERKVGGLSSSLKKNGFTFDFSGHLLHLHNEKTKKLILKLLKENYSLIKRKSQIYSNNVFSPYPFQFNLFNLPSPVRKACVSGFIKAYKKKLKEKSKNTGFLSFKNWSLSIFGEGINKHFMLPYNSKLWQYPLEKLSSDWCAPFVPVPKMEDIIAVAYLKEKENIGYNPTFYYPKKGGIQTLSNAFLKKIKNIHLNSELMDINLKTKTATIKNIGEVKYKHLINTTPLKHFLNKVTDAPLKIKKLNKTLKYTTVYVLNIGTKKINSDKHWTYFPEKSFKFYRAGISSNFSKHITPKNASSMYIEVSTYGKPINIEKTEKEIVNGLIKCGILKNSKDIIEKMWLKIECAYVIYDKERMKALPEIFDYLKKHQIHSIGRYGAWKYSFMEESIIEGLQAAQEIIKSKS
ncbi:MAG: FAD-dependent oxidoreductase [Elusimicrobia bacterium]|nr:FAD-dependent oxidoreductase [Elusimicrobiota bacterium]